MGYIANEISQLLGYPIELYLFAPGGAFTSGDAVFDDLLVSEETYVPASIKRSSIEVTREINRNVLTLDVPYDFPPAQLWFGGDPGGIQSLTIYRTHRNDGEVVQLWRGRVISVAFQGKKAAMSCEPIFTSLKRGGIRSVYGIPCRHVLFSAQCAASAGAFEFTGAISNIAGTSITVPGLSGQPDGYWVTGSLNRNRTIIAHGGDVITIDRIDPSLMVGGTARVLPGCAHDTNDCANKFNNLLNYGGFPFIPSKDPFSGDAITN